MGMGALSQEHGDRSQGTISSPWEHGDSSVRMRVWDESMWMITWEWDFFLIFCFQTILKFFDQIISFLTLIWMHGDGRCGDGSFFLVFCFQTITHFFVDHMISFLKYGEGRI